MLQNSCFCVQIKKPCFLACKMWIGLCRLYCFRADAEHIMICVFYDSWCYIVLLWQFYIVSMSPKNVCRESALPFNVSTTEKNVFLGTYSVSTSHDTKLVIIFFYFVSIFLSMSVWKCVINSGRGELGVREGSKEVGRVEKNWKGSKKFLTCFTGSRSLE